MPRTVGLLSGQDVLTLPSMPAKVAAHVIGLGVGFLPRALAEREARAGRLNILPVEVAKPAGDALIAWRPNRTGKALRWFLAQLELPGTIELLMSDHASSPAGRENPLPDCSAKSNKRTMA